jgi:hypothetical protein
MLFHLPFAPPMSFVMSLVWILDYTPSLNAN